MENKTIEQMELRHVREIQELREIAITAYRDTCPNLVICKDERADCLMCRHMMKFIQKLIKQ